jgi:LmbE family N-acetylglucosaminyl deacetylase
MTFYDPAEIFTGVVLIIAPHMDDEVLACGGTIAWLPQKEAIHVLYATDGTKSPVPMFPWMGNPPPHLGNKRIEEAKAAMSVLGVPIKNIHFLSLPDAKLKHYQDELCALIGEQIANTQADHVFVPFRYDRHPDHLAATRATFRAVDAESIDTDVFEYFIYNRYRLLSAGDIRRYVKPDHLIEIDIKAHSATKKEALLCYESQTKIIYDWQERPILKEDRVEDVSLLPEVFLKHGQRYPGSSVFDNHALWIRFVHRLEPILKEKKEQLLALEQWGRTRNGR